MKVDSTKLIAALKAKLAQVSQQRISVAVGYNAAAALKLHEMTPKNIGNPRRSGIGTYWGPSNYGNKWLEGPARQHADDIADDVKQALQNGATLLQALYLGGLRIQRESQLVVPVEYGDLKRSAFTEKE